MRTADWRDSDKMLTLFSRDFGLISALARGAKNLKNPLSAVSQPFCCGIYSFISRSGRLSVSQCEIKKEFYSLGTDFEKYATACVMMEMSEKILQNTQEYDPLFILLVTCLTHLEKGRPSREVLTYYLVRISGLLGIRPSTQECVVCGRPLEAPHLFCMAEGGTVCPACADGLKTVSVRPEDMKMIDKMLQTSPKDFCPAQGFNPRLLDLLREYLGELGELKCRSMRFL
jgi:DNA repair protein RecO (recombination protein O)